MPVRAIVGAQWGDEGKGKITDLLAERADVVIRFGGGANAGHTVVNRYGEFKLHAVPCGIFNPDCIALIGTGCVLDLDFLPSELEHLSAAGVSYEGLRISSRAHLVMPYHLVLDRLEEESRGSGTIGTTLRGVGPTYVDKAHRAGIRAGDLLEPSSLREKLRAILDEKNHILATRYNSEPLSFDAVWERTEEWRDTFGPYIVDQVELVGDALDLGREILLEGQLGALRDIDWGTYPYVTSSTTIAGGGAVGGGIPPMAIERVTGVVKAYTTAVGRGPFPTELHDDVGRRLQSEGKEVGATTGRTRRVGWFDAVAARYARRLNGFTDVAITKVDVLDSFESLKICTAYEIDGNRVNTVPSTAQLERAVPIYEDLPGWKRSTSEVRELASLPDAARAYIARIEELVGAPASFVSVGPEREQTVALHEVPAGVR